MKYLCLGYYEPERYHGLPENERAEIPRHCRPHDERLYATGKVHSVASLAEGEAVTLRPSETGVRVLDGPFSEAKEIVGSFFIVEADSKEEAVRIASLHPAAQWGAHLGFAIEVRPIAFYREAPGPA